MVSSQILKQVFTAFKLNGWLQKIGSAFSLFPYESLWVIMSKVYLRDTTGLIVISLLMLLCYRISHYLSPTPQFVNRFVCSLSMAFSISYWRRWKSCLRGRSIFLNNLWLFLSIAASDCSTNNGGCSQNAKCISNGGSSVNCTCNNGYTGSGIFCVDIDECLTSNGGCADNSVCSNTAGEIKTSDIILRLTYYIIEVNFFSTSYIVVVSTYFLVPVSLLGWTDISLLPRYHKELLYDILLLLWLII